MSTPNNGINGTLGTGLIGHWDFDNGSLLDESGNGRDLTMVGTVASVVDKDGTANGAMYFNGVSKLVTPFTDNILEPTISVWFKTDGTASTRTYVSIRGTDGYSQGFAISIHGYRIEITTNVGYSYSIIYDLDINPHVGNWHNAIAVYDKVEGCFKLYFDKKLITKNANTDNIIYTNTNYIRIGANPSEIYPDYSVDNIDEVRIYSRPLTDGGITNVGETATGEVAELYEMGVNYAEECETPVATPSGGSYTESQTVELSCSTPSSTIYYTTNGVDPDDNETLYTVPIEITDNTILKVIAYATGFGPSDILTENYIINKLEEIINEKYGNFFIATLKDKINILNHKYYNLRIVEKGLIFFKKEDKIIYTDSFKNEPLFDSFFVEEDFSKLELFDNFDNKINNIVINKGFNCSEISFQSLHGLDYYVKLDDKRFNIDYKIKTEINSSRYIFSSSTININQDFIFCIFDNTDFIDETGLIQIVHYDDSVDKIEIEIDKIYKFKNVKKIISIKNTSSITIINNSCFEYNENIYMKDTSVYFFAEQLDWVDKKNLNIDTIKSGKKYIYLNNNLVEHEDGNIEFKTLNNSDVVYKDNDFINNENIPFVNFKIKAKKDDVFFKQNFKEISIKLEVI